MRWTLQAADDETPVDVEAALPPGFHVTLIPEGVWSGDDRFVEPGSLSHRDLPLPLMGLIENTDAHQQAVAIGHIDRLELTDGMWHGWGQWAASAEAAQVRAAVRSGDVRGVSADLDDIEFEILIEAMDDDGLGILLAAVDDPPAQDLIDSGEVEVLDIPNDRMRLTRGRIMGATVVPFPAFQECTIEDLQPDEPLGGDPVLVAAAAPLRPPSGWFAPLPDRLHPFTVTDDGEVYGHIAAWSDCHISFPDRCQQPPRSPSQYAFFLTGEIPCDDGTRVRVGQLCLRGGHADRTLSAQAAMAHYDDTDSAFADVAIGEDRHGIWVHGALRPDLTPEAVRTAMASGVSGDWRMIGGAYELIALSSVNTPGFNRPRALLYEHEGLVASAIIDLPPVEREALDRAALDSVRNRIAASIGRSVDQRRAALYARVHGRSA